MNKKTEQLLNDLTTNAQLAVLVSNLIKSGKITADAFKKAVANETPDSFGGRVFFWSMVKYDDSDKVGNAMVNSVEAAMIEIVG